MRLQALGHWPKARGRMKSPSLAFIAGTVASQGGTSLLYSSGALHPDNLKDYVAFTQQRSVCSGCSVPPPKAYEEIRAFPLSS